MKMTRFDRRRNGSRIPRSMQVLLACVFVLGTALAVFFSTWGHSTSSQASGVVQLPGHVVGLIKQSHYLSATNPDASLNLSVSLKPQHASELAQYAAEISKPHSSLRGHYLTITQAAQMFGALPSTQSALITFMKRAGFQVNTIYKNRLLISFKGTVGKAEKAFQIQINNYRSPSGRQFFATTANPSVPAALAPYLQGIVGLDDAVVYTHSAVQSVKGAQTTEHPAAECPTSSSGDGYLPSQLATAYNLNGLYTAGYHGQGQSVALFELDNYNIGDIDTYISCFGHSDAAINRVQVDGGAGNPGDGAIEVELDMELILSGAPAISDLDVYEASNNVNSALDEYGQILDDGDPVVSTSWGACESDGFAQAVYGIENEIFEISALEGQSIFAASGDSGSNDCGNSTPTTPSVDDPASQPFVTGVGGTTLAINEDNSYHSETVWNNGKGEGGGGGISNIWSMPSWQQGPGVINAYSSGAPCGAISGSYCREVPDVSLDADPDTGYVMYCTVGASCSDSSWFEVGGTSAAAPMWAVMATLANEKSLDDGYYYLGFLNPLLYEIGQSDLGTSYGNDFHDVQVGNNYDTGDGHGEYPALVAYDMATGWGSYNALAAATDLETLAEPPAPNVPATSRTWYFAEGKVGQGFTEYLTLENADTIHDCAVTIQYLLGNGNPVTKSVTVTRGSRFTESVNTDLGIAANSSKSSVVSTVLKVNVGATPTCSGIVAERPLYFNNYGGVSSGTDGLGATELGTYFQFADLLTMPGYTTYLSILNPVGIFSADITVWYFAGGVQVGAPQLLTIQPGRRGTLSPPHFTQRVSALVESDEPVAVERATYFHNVNTGDGFNVSGATVVSGTEFTSNRWLFAEGYTGQGTQENLVLANINSLPVVTNTILEYSNGHQQTIQSTIQPFSQVVLNVNALSSHPTGTCDTSPCQTTNTASIDVSSLGGYFIAEREMFFHYIHGGVNAFGGTAVTGLSAYVGYDPSIPAAYSFAEGYTNTGYNQWLSLENPTGSSESIHIVLVNEKGRSYALDVTVVAKSRLTVDITTIVAQHLVHAGDGYLGYEVSMTATSNSGPFIAERPLYWNASGTSGGTDIIGFNPYNS